LVVPPGLVVAFGVSVGALVAFGVADGVTSGAADGGATVTSVFDDGFFVASVPGVVSGATVACTDGVCVTSGSFVASGFFFAFTVICVTNSFFKTFFYFNFYCKSYSSKF